MSPQHYHDERVQRRFKVIRRIAECVVALAITVAGASLFIKLVAP